MRKSYCKGNDGVYFNEPRKTGQNPSFTFREAVIAFAVFIEMFYCLCADSGEMAKHGDNSFWIALTSLVIMMVPAIAACTTTICMKGKVNIVLFFHLTVCGVLVLAWTTIYFVESVYINAAVLDTDSGVPMKPSSIFQRLAIATATYSFVLYFSSSFY